MVPGEVVRTLEEEDDATTQASRSRTKSLAPIVVEPDPDDERPPSPSSRKHHGA